MVEKEIHPPAISKPIMIPLSPAVDPSVCWSSTLTDVFENAQRCGARCMLHKMQRFHGLQQGHVGKEISVFTCACDNSSSISIHADAAPV